MFAGIIAQIDFHCSVEKGREKTSSEYVINNIGGGGADLWWME